MDGNDKQEVQPDELAQELVVKSDGLPSVRSTYDDFIEGVATRDIARGEGADAGRAARVFQTEDANGGKTVHLVGRSDIVSELGDTMERGGHRVREWHVRRPVDAAREAEKVLPALDDLIKNIPAPVLPRLGEVLKRMGLPTGGSLGRLLETGDKAVGAAEAALGLDEALKAFEPRFNENKEKGEK